MKVTENEIKKDFRFFVCSKNAMEIFPFSRLFRYGKADDMNKINHDINFTYLVVESPFSTLVCFFYDLWIW